MAGNWKMYKTAAETSASIAKLAPMVAAATHADVVVCAPFVNLPAAVEAAESTKIEVGAQDVFWLKEGAYTGEVSAPMLAAIGCKWVIIGHSERRQYFGETEETVLKKTVAALEEGLTPIVCVGERLEQREAGTTESVLAAQFAGGLGGLAPEQFAGIAIAYEPVWAIGTGKTATPEMAADAHLFLRDQIRLHFGAEASGSLPHSLRRQRETGQRKSADGADGAGWSAGGRGQSRSGVVRVHRKFLMRTIYVLAFAAAIASAQTQSILDLARKAPPEIFADAVVKLVERGEIPPAILLQTGGVSYSKKRFEAAKRAREPVRLTALPGVRSDTRAALRDSAGALGLDALSLQSRVIKLMAATDPTRARELFQSVEHPALEARPCADPMIADVSAYYEMAAQTASSDLMLTLVQARSPGELANFAKVLAAFQELPPENLRVLVGALALKMGLVAPDYRSFTMTADELRAALERLAERARGGNARTGAAGGGRAKANRRADELAALQ